jgi:uncharacterized protein YkwD
MKTTRIALAAAAFFFIGLFLATEAFPAGKPDEANLRLGTVRLGGDGTLHFKFGETPTAERKIENMDVYSHKGVRYDGQSLRSVVDWLSRRRKPTPALVFAKTDPRNFQKSLGSGVKPIDDHGLVFVPRSTPRPVPKGKPAVSKTQAEVLRLVNAARRQYGLQPLSLNSKLCAACGDHSRTMAAYGFFSHTSPVAGKYYFTDRARAYGTTAGAENIATGAGTAAAVVQMWLGSPGHSANMLNPGFRTMGIGRSGGYWTQMFGQ